MQVVYKASSKQPFMQWHGKGCHTNVLQGRSIYPFMQCDPLSTGHMCSHI